MPSTCEEAVGVGFTGPVLVVGTGLIGTSIGLALRRAGIEVALSDADQAAMRLATSVGAGDRMTDAVTPRMVVVAVPPDQVGALTIDALSRWPGAVVTDVGSVKVKPLLEVDRSGVPYTRYVGSHPMAGSERSGPLAAAADLFDGRAWAVTPHEHAEPAAVDDVERLVNVCGATLVRLSPDEHDLAVARVSHLPHVLAVVTANRLVGAPRADLALSGQGLRDVTRIAGGDPRLWEQILAANADAVTGLLREVRKDLDSLIGGLEAAAGGRPHDDADALSALLSRGVEGAAAIPGKHGKPAPPTATLFVLVPDEPGALASVFAAAGEVGVNIEDVRIDHDPGRPVGLMELSVAESDAESLRAALTTRGWAVHR
jgi:prephenate dehydrogenase